MKIRYKTKLNKKKIKLLFSFFVFILGIIIGFKALDNTAFKITDKELAQFLLEEANIIEKESSFIKVKNLLKNLYNEPTKLLLLDIPEKSKVEQVTPVVKNEENKTNPPIIYIYNSHQTEEYAPSTFLEYSVKPTVMMANYILEETFNNNDFQTLVEESSIKQILNNNGWKYSYSYQASRILLEQRQQENPSLKYYIDVHRDSLAKERTTVEINGKQYAKTIFLIGLENPNYETNLAFTTKINNCLNVKYPNLSKGIYKKGGVGVNGIYNQDFSPYAVLIEIGGYENTTTEVMNSTLAFSECFLEVITENESKGIN